MSQESEHYEAGVARQARGELDDAIAYLQRVGPGHPRYADAQRRVGRMLLDADRPEDALTATRRALGEEETAAGYGLLGEVYAALERHDDAEAAFARALRLQPNDPDGYVLRGHARVAAGRLPEAVRSYEEAIARDNKHVAARYFLAETLVRAQDFVRAATQLHYVLTLAPGYAPAVRLRGDLAFHQADFRQAIVEYCAAVDSGEADAALYERLGTAFMAIGDLDQALKAFEEAVGLDAEAWEAVIGSARLLEAKGLLKLARRRYATVAYVPAYRAEAGEAIARLDAALAHRDEPEPPTAEAPAPRPVLIDPPRAFEAPEVLTRSSTGTPGGRAGTSPLNKPFPKPGTTPLKPGTQPLKPPLPPRGTGRIAPRPDER